MRSLLFMAGVVIGMALIYADIRDPLVGRRHVGWTCTATGSGVGDTACRQWSASSPS